MDLQTFIDALKSFSNSDVFDAVAVGSLAAAFGAFFGARGAQAVISRNQKQQALIAELNAVNGGLAMCFFICNRFLSLKQQHVKSLRNEYVQAKDVARTVREAAQNQAGAPPQVIEFVMDLQTIAPIKIPTERLEHFVFEKISVRGRAPIAAANLVGAIDGLHQSINLRNELIVEYRDDPPASHEERAIRYFGFKNAQGIIDERYSSSIDAIYEQTDDCIFFARTLADDLYKYGVKLRKKSAWLSRWRVPKLTKTDWSKAEKNRLMPPNEQYEGWLRGFEKRQSKIRLLLNWFGFTPSHQKKSKEKSTLPP